MSDNLARILEEAQHAEWVPIEEVVVPPRLVVRDVSARMRSIQSGRLPVLNVTRRYRLRNMASDLEACRRLGWTHVPVYVDPSSRRDEDAEEAARRRESDYYREVGRRGGMKGGRARAAKLPAARRSAIARRAALARWRKQRLAQASPRAQ